MILLIKGCPLTLTMAKILQIIDWFFLFVSDIYFDENIIIRCKLILLTLTSLIIFDKINENIYMILIYVWLSFDKHMFSNTISVNFNLSLLIIILNIMDNNINYVEHNQQYRFLDNLIKLKTLIFLNIINLYVKKYRRTKMFGECYQIIIRNIMH